MKFLKHIRSRSRVRNGEPAFADSSHYSNARSGTRQDPSARLSDAVLELILSYICPHTQDDSYFSAEDSLTENGCMLCDLRDLAHCAVVNRRWRQCAQRLLYWSVRIDAVHYCDREQVLADKRKRRSFLNRNADPASAPQERLRLFAETVRRNPKLAISVHFLKIAYMTRENCKDDLARAVSVLPNLRYVDVPDGFFADDPSCRGIRAEMQSRCPEMRKMKYSAGSEQAFTQLASGRWWQNLDTLELSNLTLNPNIFLAVLSSLPVIHVLSLSDFLWMDDTIFQPGPGIPQLPPLQTLSMSNMPNVTASGLSTYLSWPGNREILDSLTLTNTGVIPSTLQRVLSAATRLKTLAYTTTVDKPLTQTTPVLSSPCLVTLHYELTSSNPSTTNAAQSYYTALANALHSSALPSLSTLYVLTANFAETLLLTPPKPAFLPETSRTMRSPPQRHHQEQQQLAVFSKGEDAVSWEFTSLDAPGGVGNRSSGRPMSTISIGSGMMAGGLAPVLGGGARKSVVVKGGAGGFLAVPGDGSGNGGSWV